jgi:hypothetical protein
MTLLIACFLIYGLKLHWGWYITAVVIWLVKHSGIRVALVQNINQDFRDGDSTHE